jgi:hypothetical protein
MPLSDFDPRFRNLTPELLAQLPHEEVPFAVQQHVLMRIQGDVEREPDILASLPAGTRGVHAALVLDAEVKNGGFNQFFWNSSHHIAAYALEGLDYIGAQEHAALLRSAFQSATSERERLMPYHVEGSLEAFSASYREGVFEDLDTRYYSLPELTDIIADAIHSNPKRFCSG